MKTEELLTKIGNLFEKEYKQHIKIKPLDENGFVSVEDHEDSLKSALECTNKKYKIYKKYAYYIQKNFWMTASLMILSFIIQCFLMVNIGLE